MRILFLVVNALLLSWCIVAYSNSCPDGQRWDDCNRTSAGPGACIPKCISVCPNGQTWNDCSGPQFGGGGCIPGCFGEPTLPPSNEFTGPAELCLPEGCQPVSYSWLGNIVVAESHLPNDYAVLGWSGPCLDTKQQCPGIFNQAFTDLRLNALRANRAQRYE